MLTIRDLTIEEERFFKQLKTVEIIKDVTMHDADNNLFTIPAGRESYDTKGCNIYFSDENYKEVAINMAFFGEYKNTEYFNYIYH